MAEAAATLSPIGNRYLICLNVKGYRDSRGRRYFDRLWHKDLIGHLRYLKDLTLAAPCQEGEPPPDAVLWDPSLPGIRFVDLPAPDSTLRAILDLPVTAARLWREIGRAEVVHPGIAGWPIPMGWLACPMAWLRRKPYVLIVESAPWRSRPGVRRRLSEVLGRWCAGHARLLIATQPEYLTSLGGRRQNPGHVILASWVDEENIISDAEAVEAWRAKRAGGDRTLKLLFAGRLEPSKGVPVLLEAMRLLSAENAPVQLDILGQGDLLEECRRTANVGIMGRLPYGPEFFRMLRSYHAVVVPSLSDEQPRIVYDAFSQAVPVLASDTPGLRACVEDGRTGIFAAAHDAASWAGVFQWSLRHFAEMERMGMAGIEVARGMTHREMHDKRWRLLVRMLGERGAS